MRLADGVVVDDNENVSDDVLEIVDVGGKDLVPEAEVVSDKLEVGLALLDRVSGTDVVGDTVTLGVVEALAVGRVVIVPVGLMLIVDDSDAVAVGSALSEADAVIGPVNE